MGESLYSLPTSRTPVQVDASAMWHSRSSGPTAAKCKVAHNYPWAFGPRIGMAYQMNSATVLRIGAGISYNRTDNNNLSYSVGGPDLHGAVLRRS